MAGNRSAAQKAADKRYREAHKGADVSWGTRLKPDEASALDEIIKSGGMNRAEFLRWAMDERRKIVLSDEAACADGESVEEQ